MGALLDTSVVLDLDQAAVVAALPADCSISALTLAELAAGPTLASDKLDAARRQFRLQQVEALFSTLAFDADAARAYGQVVAAIAAHGRSPRPRVIDLLIASVAIAHGLDLYTRSSRDVAGLDALLRVVRV